MMADKEGEEKCQRQVLAFILGMSLNLVEG